MDHNVTDVLHKCIFCDKLLDGQSVILKCLHTACKNCLTTKKTSFGLSCICLETTYKEFKDYPLVAPRNHKKNQGVDVTTKDLAFCSSCNEKPVEVYCTICCVIICSLCHLSSHREHKFEILEKYGNDIRSNLQTQKLCLEKNNLYLKYCLDGTDKQIRRLELKKLAVYNQIDLEMEFLISQIKKRGFELKNSVDANVAEIISSANVNKNIFQDMFKKNKYYIALTDYIVNHDNICDVINLSKVVIDQTMYAKNNVALVSKSVPIMQLDLNFEDKNSDKCISVINEVGEIIPCEALNIYDNVKKFKLNNTKNCVSFVKEVGDIVPCEVLNVSDNITSTKSPLNFSQPCEEQEEVLNVSDNIISTKSPMNVSQPCEEQENVDMPLAEDETNSDVVTITSGSDDNSETLLECSACNQWSLLLMKCTYCNRYYHNSCHIPSLQDTDNNTTLKNWKCTLCKDITNYSNSFANVCVSNDSPLNLDGKKVMERVLLELYCQNEDSEHFRECPARTAYPLYYQKIANPISFDDIKTRLQSDSYTKLLDVIDDINLVFSNATQFYTCKDPYHISACSLQDSLNKLLAKWLPKVKSK